MPPSAPGAPPLTFTPTEATVVTAGALGKMTFHWRLDGGPEQPSTGEQVVPEQTQPNVPKPL